MIRCRHIIRAGRCSCDSGEPKQHWVTRACGRAATLCTWTCTKYVIPGPVNLGRNYNLKCHPARSSSSSCSEPRERRLACRFIIASRRTFHPGSACGRGRPERASSRCIRLPASTALPAAWSDGTFAAAAAAVALQPTARCIGSGPDSCNSPAVEVGALAAAPCARNVQGRRKDC